MLHVTLTPSQRLARRRTHDHRARDPRPATTTRQRPMPRGEAFAIGLGCDNYKR